MKREWTIELSAENEEEACRILHSLASSFQASSTVCMPMKHCFMDTGKATIICTNKKQKT